MKPVETNIDDLLANESFLKYCKQSSAEDVAFWENYILENPGRRLLLEEAKEKFVQLFNALAVADLAEQETRLIKGLNLLQSAPIVQMEGFERKKSRGIISMLLKATSAAAVLILAVLFTINYSSIGKNKGTKTFLAAYGERKNIQLPDGSYVILNAGSKIEINESFAVSTRGVFLEGEAFFDVKHNEKLPFIVHTSAMDIKALGTAFNVKAYLNEKNTETSLIRGLIEVTLKESDNRKMLLYPNQKIKWEQPLKKIVYTKAPKLEKGDNLIATESLVKKLLVTDDGDIKEIAWKDNKLIFEDELLSDIAVLLERWYGVQIEFMDETIRNYRFTGTFNKEDINTVLNFLKESRTFNYDIVTGETVKIKLSE
jgi:transmembrane sensor